MSFYSIDAKYNEPLQALVAVIDDERYDMVEWWGAGQVKPVLSDQLSCRNIASTQAIILRSANELL